MKRISEETFINGNWGECVTGLRVENGNFYWLCDIEEWSDSPEFNKEGYRIFAPYKGEIELQRDQLIINGNLNVYEAEDYERTPMIYDYETEEICNEYKSVYELMLGYIQPYERNGKSDPGDYDIFIMTREELCDFCDALRDGDYIIVLKENY